MWGHSTGCRCGVCLTLQRVCRHIRDYSGEPGYIDFAADRLRVLAGEVSDFIDSRQRDTGLRAASRGPGLLTPGGEGESGGGPGGGERSPGHQDQVAAAKEEQVESSRSCPPEVKSEASVREETEERGGSQAKSEATSHPSTAPKKLAKAKDTGREPLPRRDSRRRTKEEPAKSEREEEGTGTPHSDQKKKRRRRTRSRSRRRRRRREG